MIQMCHLKALNQVLITFCQTAILECTLKVVGHFASWSHCARLPGPQQIAPSLLALQNYIYLLGTFCHGGLQNKFQVDLSMCQLGFVIASMPASHFIQTVAH